MTIEDLDQQVELDDSVSSIFVEIHFANGGVATRKAALVAFAFTDEAGESVVPVSPYLESERFGPYFYLHAGPDEVSVSRTTIPRPEGATRLTLRGHPWLSKTPVEVVGAPTIVVERPGSESTFADSAGKPASVLIDQLKVVYDVEPGVRYRVEWTVDAAPGAQALMLFDYQDATGASLPPGPEFQIQPQFGAFTYAVGPDGEGTRAIEITVPRGVARLVLTGQTWKTGAITVPSRPVVTGAGLEVGALSSEQLVQHLGAIPSDAKVLVVYTTAGPISLKNSLLRRSNRLAMEYADAGWNVVFLAFGTPAPDESGLIAERILQVGRDSLSLVMDVLLARTGANNVLLCSSFADMSMVGLLDRCHDHGWRVIYEVRDDMEEFKRVGYSKWYEQNFEVRFAKRADAVLAVSPRLRDKIAVITGREDVQLVPNAAPDALIEAAAPLRTAEAWERRARLRKVGYVGHLTASWFDWPWLLASADELSDVRFEIIGHGMPDDLVLPSNVRYLGPKTHDECLPYVEEWSAGLVPFKISRLTYGVDPNKAYEYVAMGIRTISAPMGQVESMPGVLTYTTQRGMAEAIRASVSKPLGAQELEGFEDYLATASWSERAGRMLNILEGE
ncbi:hypothetical protein [Cellulomonas fimi]|uniref:Glycosyltransferase family 4 protein n=1 Tax=Cellulomonas fimi TaxID=1708 RepID=A0A7Y0LYE7_CELFI|nr:hypothetical protein [Cellulomonas fimi]NMR20532.1 glycosyltransferase family 4 protein [Cellulomonas fimi]